MDVSQGKTQAKVSAPPPSAQTASNDMSEGEGEDIAMKRHLFCLPMCAPSCLDVGPLIVPMGWAQCRVGGVAISRASCAPFLAAWGRRGAVRLFSSRVAVSRRSIAPLTSFDSCVVVGGQRERADAAATRQRI